MILTTLCVALLAAQPTFPDGDCEALDLGPWVAYGTPVKVAKVAQPHSGQRALQIVTDNLDAMGGGFEGASRTLCPLQVGDRIRVRLWLRPQAGKVILVGIGKTSFESLWRVTDSDWFEVVCDFRCTGAGLHKIWISQNQAAADFLVDDVSLQLRPRVTLGEAPEADRVALEAREARAWFDRSSGALCGLENLRTGITVAPVGVKQPTFALERLDSDGRSYELLGFEQARLTKFEVDRQHALRTDFELPDQQLAVSIRWTVAGDELRGTIEVRNDGERPVTAVTFPLIQDVCPATDPATVTLVDPYVGGRVVPNAINSRGCETAFPGRGVMGWCDLSGPRGGISVQSRDRTWLGTRLSAVPAGERSFDLALTPEPLIQPGQSWASGEMVALLHSGDWHAAADRYRDWLTSWQPGPDVPAWMRHCNGWVLIGCQNGIPFHRLPYYYRQAEWMGLDYLHVQGEHIDSFWYDEQGKRHSGSMTLPVPSPFLGGETDLKGAIQNIHQLGGKVMFYFLYERFAPSLATADFLAGGRRADVPEGYRIPDAEFYPTNCLLERPDERPAVDNAPFVRRVMCLDSPGWRDWMQLWGVDIYGKRLGSDGMYWDVTGRNGPFRCYNAAHGHHGENDWARGVTDIMQRVNQAGRELDPNYSSAIEGVSASLRPYVGFHLMSGATQQPEVFRYTLPDVLTVDGFSNHTWKWTHPEKARRVFLAGERFDTHGYDARIKPIIQLHEQLREFTDWPARFVDTVGVTTSDPRVEARRFVRDDEGNRVVAVTLLNENAIEGATIAVEPPAGEVTVHLCRLGGAIETVTPQAGAKGALVLPVPTDAVSGYLLAAATAPAQQVVLTARQDLTPGQDGVLLNLLAPAGKLPELKVVVKDRLNVPGQPTELLVDEPSHRTVRLLPGGGTAALIDWDRVDITATWDGGSATCWTVATPPLVNGDFEQLDRGWLAFWGETPCEVQPHRGRSCLEIDPATSRYGHVAALAALKPNVKYRFSGWLKRATDEAQVTAAIVEYGEGSQLQFSCQLGPVTATGEWQYFTKEFASRLDPRNTLLFCYNKGGAGKAWFDDLRLEELP